MRFNMGHFKVQHIDKHRKMRRQLVSKENKIRQQLPTSFENYVEVFAKLGFPITTNNFKSIFTAEGGNLHCLPEQIGMKGENEKWIGIAPFAAHKGKIYPKEQMHEVVRLLTEKYPMPQCTCVSWHLDGIEQELILMSHLDVMLSMDSANMHMASLTGIPVVSVWGATHPMAGFMGWNQDEKNAVQIDMDCRPCSIYGQKPCIHGDYRCMTGIKPEMIVEKISAILEK